MAKKVLLTTFDNPFDPFEDFDHWFMFDIDHNYNTSALLARVANYSDEMTEEEQDLETERAIDSILETDFMNIYKKIEKESNTTPLT